MCARLRAAAQRGGGVGRGYAGSPPRPVLLALWLWLLQHASNNSAAFRGPWLRNAAEEGTIFSPRCRAALAALPAPQQRATRCKQGRNMSGKALTEHHPMLRAPSLSPCVSRPPSHILLPAAATQHQEERGSPAAPRGGPAPRGAGARAAGPARPVRVLWLGLLGMPLFWAGSRLPELFAPNAGMAAALQAAGAPVSCAGSALPARYRSRPRRFCLHPPNRPPARAAGSAWPPSTATRWPSWTRTTSPLSSTATASWRPPSPSSRRGCSRWGSGACAVWATPTAAALASLCGLMPCAPIALRVHAASRTTNPAPPPLDGAEQQGRPRVALQRELGALAGGGPGGDGVRRGRRGARHRLHA